MVRVGYLLRMGSTFMTTLNPCPFGFYTSNPQFQADADKVVVFVLRKLGEDILGVELSHKQIWACFEEATLGFNALMVEYQAMSNLASLLGTPTGSLDPETGFSVVNLTDVYVKSNLEFMIRQQEQYAAEIGYGTSAFTMSGSINLEEGRQDYDLYTELLDPGTSSSLAGLQPSGSVGKLKIFEVYHYSPVNYLFNQSYFPQVGGAQSGEGYALGLGGTRYSVLPIYEDTLRAGMLEEAGKLRRSHYSYKVTGRTIRIFPVPSSVTPGVNDQIWLRVGWGTPSLPGYMDTLLVSGSAGAVFNAGLPGFVQDQTLFGVSNPANVPFGLINYTTLNPWARNWIYQYTLALAKELLGLIRSKIKSLPLPSEQDIELNGEALITQAREDKAKMMETIMERLESLSFDKLAEKEASKAESLLKLLALQPFPPEWVIKSC